MGKITFSDGVKFNTDGELRPEHRSDGWYVVGQGILMPVSSYEEALEEIAKMRGEAKHQLPNIWQG